MLKDKLVKKTVYFSLAMQLITTLISLDGLNYTLRSEDKILKDILLLEAFVQVVEAGFYIWVIMALKDLKIMAPRRYIDWFVTTPTMLFSTAVFMEYEVQKTRGVSFTLTEFIENHKVTLAQILGANALMLLFGYLGEIGQLETHLSVGIGSVWFVASFYLLYENFAKHTAIGRKLFYFLVGVWALYAVAACLNLRQKNTMYNLLDIVSKNFYGLFIYGYIRSVGTRNGLDL